MSVPSPYANIQRNSESRKMLQAKMIRLKKNITYNNSRSLQIYETILSAAISDPIQADIDKNKDLFISLGKNPSGNFVYDTYYHNLLRNQIINNETRGYLTILRQDIINSLTFEEKIRYGFLDLFTANEDISYNEILITSINNFNEQLILNPDFTFYCKMKRSGNNYNLILKNTKKKYRLIPGRKYIFNLEDSTNFGFQFSLSYKKYVFNDKNIENELTHIGTPGTSGAYVVYQPSKLTNYSQAFIYNRNKREKNSFNVFGYIYPFVTIHLDYYFPSTTVRQKITNIESLNSESSLKSSVLLGQKYLFKPQNEQPESSNSIFFYTYERNKQYGMYYGRYHIKTTSSTNLFTIINKGFEDKIRISGDENKMQIIHLDGLNDMGSNDTDLDGSYNFYYGDIYIDVYDNFDTCAFYSSIYGYNNMEELFIFDENSINESSFPLYDTSNTFVEDISNGLVLESLYPHSQFEVDVSNEYRYMYLNTNSSDISDISYNENKRYGVQKGQYIIHRIPHTNPIAFINHDISGHFEYYGSETNKKIRLGADGKKYPFYHGSVVIRVYGNFGKVTMYDFYNGYAGGYELIHYQDVSNVYTEEITLLNSDKSVSQDFVGDISYVDISGDFDISYVNSYLPNDYDSSGILIGTGPTDLSYIYLDGVEIADNVKYGFNTGNYVIRNIPEEFALTFLNHNLTDKFNFDGYLGYKKSRVVNDDGQKYDFYYGNVNLYITGDFGQLSFYTYNYGFLNGRRKLIFSHDASFGHAIVHNGIDSYFPYECEVFDNSGNTEINYRISVKKNIQYVVNSVPYNYFTFSGYDRYGRINELEQNPTLFFSQADNVIFEFEYDNSSFPFGIYQNYILLDDIPSEEITNNNNTDNIDISWNPSTPVQNTFYYRASNPESIYITWGRIQILENISPLLNPNFINAEPSVNSTISIEPIISLTFDKKLVVNSSKSFYFIDASENELSYSGSNISGSGTTTINFVVDNLLPLYYDTSYSFVIDDTLLKTFCSRDVSFEVDPSGRFIIGDYITESLYPNVSE
tara:strand:- start:1480 stop:4578 length:3099 start_codon:yes stop_codon:yes gene_type:complete